MPRTLLAALLAAGLTAPVFAQHPQPASRPAPTGTYNFNNPVYHGVYPPTGSYPGGVVSSHAYTNPGDTIPTTYITHYRATSPVPVYVPVVPVTGYTYTETVWYGGYAPPVYHGLGRVRWR
jgi:hypothetical protein